jgi:hypothetical protein
MLDVWGLVPDRNSEFLFAIIFNQFWNLPILPACVKDALFLLQ